MLNLPAATDTVAEDRQWRLRRQARDRRMAERSSPDDDHR